MQSVFFVGDIEVSGMDNLDDAFTLVGDVKDWREKIKSPYPLMGIGVDKKGHVSAVFSNGSTHNTGYRTPSN